MRLHTVNVINSNVNLNVIKHWKLSRKMYKIAHSKCNQFKCAFKCNQSKPHRKLSRKMYEIDHSKCNQFKCTFKCNQSKPHNWKLSRKMYKVAHSKCNQGVRGWG